MQQARMRMSEIRLCQPCKSFRGLARNCLISFATRANFSRGDRFGGVLSSE
jgi:hypothetical protein